MKKVISKLSLVVALAATTGLSSAYANTATSAPNVTYNANVAKELDNLCK